MIQQAEGEEHAKGQEGEQQANDGKKAIGIEPAIEGEQQKAPSRCSGSGSSREEQCGRNTTLVALIV